MSSTVVTRAATLVCDHQGRRSLSDLSEAEPVKLTVRGRDAVVLADAGSTGTYVGCPTRDSNGKPHECMTTTVVSKGATRLTAGGRPVLLATDKITAVNDIGIPVAASVTVDVGSGPQKLTAT